MEELEHIGIVKFIVDNLCSNNKSCKFNDDCKTCIFLQDVYRISYSICEDRKIIDYIPNSNSYFKNRGISNKLRYDILRIVLDVLRTIYGNGVIDSVILNGMINSGDNYIRFRDLAKLLVINDLGYYVIEHYCYTPDGLRKLYKSMISDKDTTNINKEYIINLFSGEE